MIEKLFELLQVKASRPQRMTDNERNKPDMIDFINASHISKGVILITYASTVFGANRDRVRERWK